MDMKKIKIYDLAALFEKEGVLFEGEKLEPYCFKKIAVFEGNRGVIVAEHEAVQLLENTIKDTVMIPANPPSSPGMIWAIAKYEVEVPIEELMQAPYEEKTMEEFFDRRSYNPRCQQNFAALLKNLDEIEFDLRGYFPEKHASLKSQICSASAKTNQQTASEKDTRQLFISER